MRGILIFFNNVLKDNLNLGMSNTSDTRLASDPPHWAQDSESSLWLEADWHNYQQILDAIVKSHINDWNTDMV